MNDSQFYEKFCAIMEVTDLTTELRPDVTVFDNNSRDQISYVTCINRVLREFMSECVLNSKAQAKAKAVTVMLSRTVAMNQLLENREFLNAISKLDVARQVQ